MGRRRTAGGSGGGRASRSTLEAAALSFVTPDRRPRLQPRSGARAGQELPRLDLTDDQRDPPIDHRDQRRESTPGDLARVVVRPGWRRGQPVDGHQEPGRVGAARWRPRQPAPTRPAPGHGSPMGDAAQSKQLESLPITSVVATVRQNCPLMEPVMTRGPWLADGWLRAWRSTGASPPLQRWLPQKRCFPRCQLIRQRRRTCGCDRPKCCGPITRRPV